MILSTSPKAKVILSTLSFMAEMAKMPDKKEASLVIFSFLTGVAIGLTCAGADKEIISYVHDDLMKTQGPRELYERLEQDYKTIVFKAA